MKSDKAKDIAYSIVKSGLGAVPFAGSAAIELFMHVVTPPIEKRRIEWMHDIGERLANLENQGDIKLSELQDNPEFIDTVIKSTQYVQRTSEAEKVGYFRNALINTAIGESPEQSESQIFLSLLDSFTIWHVRILKLFDNPSRWFEINKIAQPQNVIGGGLKIVLETAFPELKSRTDFCNLVWEDLKRAGLHNSGSLGAMMTGSGLLQNQTTDIGRRFLQFIEIKC